MRLALAVLTLVFAVGAAAQLSPLDKPAASTQGPQAPTNALDKQDLAFYVRHLYVYKPQINIEVGDYVESAMPGLFETTVRASYRLASKEHKFYISKDGKNIVEGSTYVVDKNPFQSTIEKIDTLPAPAFGTEGAPVVVVAYSDFQCPYCAKEAKVIRGQLKDAYPDNVRVYFRDFPLPSHNWAKDAAVAGRCIYIQEPEVFWDYHDWVFENQQSMTPENLPVKVGEFASDKGLDTLKLSQCLSAKATLNDVEASVKEGQSIGVSSTPTIVINGRKVGGSQEFEQLKAIIDYEIEYQKVTHNAGDDCGCAADVTGFPAP